MSLLKCLILLGPAFGQEMQPWSWHGFTEKGRLVWGYPVPQGGRAPLPILNVHPEPLKRGSAHRFPRSCAASRQAEGFFFFFRLRDFKEEWIYFPFSQFSPLKGQRVEWDFLMELEDSMRCSYCLYWVTCLFISIKL